MSDYDLVVRGGLVADGSGNPARRADVDLFLFDPEAIRRPSRKELVHDLPGGVGRFQAVPNGVAATVVNGVPIVVDAKITDAYPGRVVSPA
jgi:N-acyl-D-aspartate/D-glutamate deacylase